MRQKWNLHSCCCPGSGNTTTKKLSAVPQSHPKPWWTLPLPPLLCPCSSATWFDFLSKAFNSKTLKIKNSSLDLDTGLFQTLSSRIHFKCQQGFPAPGRFYPSDSLAFTSFTKFSQTNMTRHWWFCSLLNIHNIRTILGYRYLHNIHVKTCTTKHYLSRRNTEPPKVTFSEVLLPLNQETSMAFKWLFYKVCTILRALLYFCIFGSNC